MRIPASYPTILAVLFMMPIPVLIIDLDYQVPKGIPVYIAEQPKFCADGRIIVVYVLRDGFLKLNSEKLKRDDLKSRLHEIFQTMAERVLFVKGDPGLPFQKVLEVIDIARTEVDYVALLTPYVEKEATANGVWCLTIPNPHRQTTR